MDNLISATLCDPTAFPSTLYAWPPSDLTSLTFPLHSEHGNERLLTTISQYDTVRRL